MNPLFVAVVDRISHGVVPLCQHFLLFCLCCSGKTCWPPLQDETLPMTPQIPTHLSHGATQKFPLLLLTLLQKIQKMFKGSHQTAARRSIHLTTLLLNLGTQLRLLNQPLIAHHRTETTFQDPVFAHQRVLAAILHHKTGILQETLIFLCFQSKIVTILQLPHLTDTCQVAQQRMLHNPGVVELELICLLFTLRKIWIIYLELHPALATLLTQWTVVHLTPPVTLSKQCCQHLLS